MALLEKLAALIVAPALAAALLRWLVAGAPSARRSWPVVVACGLGILVGWSASLGGLAWPPRLSMDATLWLPWLLVPITALAALVAARGAAPPPGRGAVCCAAVAAALLLLPSWSAIHFQWGWLGGLGRLCAVATLAALPAAASTRALAANPGRRAWIAVTVAVPGTCAALALAGSVRLAELALPVAACSAALALSRPPASRPQLCFPATFALAALLLNGHAYAELPLGALLLALAGPALAGRMPPEWPWRAVGVSAALPGAAALWAAASG